mmetsp:Transcript_22645/g.21817  ORF Transcript_22645/g.21817 Transcript_22645/m.21817 type:complete len:117 (-) Transcript_22645:914-1264(-)
MKRESKQEKKSVFDQISSFFKDPNQGPPKYEQMVMTVLVIGIIYLYLRSTKPSTEITYMDFLNNYLTKNQVKMVTLSEDKHSDTFKYKAEIESLEGKKVHLVLAQVENFLYKLDMA